MVLNDNKSKPIGKTNNTSVGLRYDYDNNVRMSMGKTGNNSYNNTSKTLANEYGYRTTRHVDNNRSTSMIINSLIDIVEP